jgi:hypothetical protein
VLAVIWLWKSFLNRVLCVGLGGVRVLLLEPFRVSWTLGFGSDL